MPEKRRKKNDPEDQVPSAIATIIGGKKMLKCGKAEGKGNGGSSTGSLIENNLIRASGFLAYGGRDKIGGDQKSKDLV